MRRKNLHPIWSAPELSNRKLKGILSKPEKPEFFRYASRLLESTAEPEEVWKFLSPKTLIEYYPQIRAEMSDSWRSGNRRVWDDVVETLEEMFKIKRTKKHRASFSTGTILSQNLGRRIRNLRERLEISQTDLAGLMGISKQAVHSIEKGKTKVTLDRLRKILAVLGFQANIVFEPIPSGTFSSEKNSKRVSAEKI